MYDKIEGSKQGGEGQGRVARICTMGGARSVTSHRLRGACGPVRRPGHTPNDTRMLGVAHVRRPHFAPSNKHTYSYLKGYLDFNRNDRLYLERGLILETIKYLIINYFQFCRLADKVFKFKTALVCWNTFSATNFEIIAFLNDSFIHLIIQQVIRHVMNPGHK